jgi:hypothetical protein
MPVAYPLPYGEYLAETEALQLLTAHDLYNELRNLIASIQVSSVIILLHLFYFSG